MLKAVGATFRRALQKTIWVFGEAVSVAMMLVLAFAPAAAAIAVGCLLRHRLVALSLFAGVSLGTFLVWRFRDLRNRAVDCKEPEPSTQRRQPMAPPVVAPAMAPVANDLLVFHDFDRVKNRFDHWAIGEP